MVELTDAEYDAALDRGRAFRATAPHARAARYDAATRRIVIELENGTEFAFPAVLAERLDGASAAELAEVQIIGDGYGLHWPSRDEDLTVPGLMAGVFGRQKWMDQLVERGLLPEFKRAA